MIFGLVSVPPLGFFTSSVSVIAFLLFHGLLELFFCNNRSALDHASFVDSAISDLLLAGSVIEVFTPPTVVNPLTVSVNSVGKRRLILDLRHVNKFIPKVKFKMEDSRTFLNYVHSPGYMFKFDMKSGYHHVSALRVH